jgi:sugar lactone lactonase YvrE
VSWPDKRLERISCPDFDTKATYKLPKRSYRIAVNGRGMLYAVAQIAEKGRPPLPWFDFGIADLEIYDTNKPGEPGETLQPTKTIPVGGVITQLCMSPDDAWMYYLDVHNRKVGRVNLKEGKLDGENDQIVPGTNSMCLTPNGKKLYTCSNTNAVQILDPATLKIEKTIRFHEANPTGIQATDKGYVFLNSGNGQWTHIYLLYAARDYKGERASVIPWGGVYHTNSLALHPDQQCLYASCFSLSPSNITAFSLPPKPTMSKGRQCGSIGLDGHNAQGQMIISRDGKFMFSDRGLILSLGR